MTTVDITPSPRVLRMLGQIDFAPWQCLAELIDNSIDAFIEQVKTGVPPTNPVIRIQLPTEARIRAGVGELTIIDNGRGMTLDQLTNAVRAGYSGNDPVEKMGLFGMGFNISTARLGRRTEVWTTTADAADWTGIVIDFDQLERSRAFHAPIQSRPKTRNELDDGTHGTEIKIARLESDRMRPLIRGAGKGRTKERLGKIYGQVMSRLGVTILYDGDRIVPRKHCFWDPKRFVEHATFGQVPAIIRINEELPPRRFCTTCWVWLVEGETVCSACGHAENVIERKRALSGWIGVQRYFDKEHYGFDLIRNGRVIEELDKSMFKFEPEDGDPILEYPIDATHWGGRFVGELEIDFVRVSHQKDSFDKLDPEWKRVVEIVRGKSPIQPLIAKRMGLEPNTSPLARLFAGYRKGTAGLKDLVPGDEKGVGLNTREVVEYRDRFYAGEPEYQSDDKWFDLVLQAEQAKLGRSKGAKKAAGDLPGIEDPVGSSAEGDKPSDPSPADGSTEPVKPKRDPETKDVRLSKEYTVGSLPGAPTIRVDAYRHSAEIDDQPFRVRPEGYNFRFDYNEHSKYFEESLETPLDCLLADLANHFLAVSAQSPRTYPISRIARTLRETYFPEESDNVDQAADAASSLLGELRLHYDEHLIELAPIEPSKLSRALIEQVRRSALQAEGASSADVDQKITQGRFAKYVAESQVVDLVLLWPHLSTDGKFFSIPLEKIAQPELKQLSQDDLIAALRDVVWLAEVGSASISKDEVWRLRFARALSSLRLVQSWRS